MADAAPDPASQDAPDLFHGGLLYRVLRKFRVDASVARQAAKNAALAGIVLWVPLAIAALVEGNAFPGKVRVPFFFDVAAWVRPLVVVPLLLIAEPILAASWRWVGARFKESGIVGPEAVEAYDALVARSTRIVDRWIPEFLALGLALACVVNLIGVVLSEPRSIWFAVVGADGATHLTIAGIWAAFAVHGAIFYLTFRWLWLLSVWYRFLFGVARLPIRIFPAHPDRAGGLGFLGRAIGSAAPLLFAWSAAMAAAIANQMIHHGAHLPAFLPVGIAVLVFALVVFVLPPALFFVIPLAKARRRALDEWSKRMARVVERGRAESLANPVAQPEPDLGGLEEIEIAVSAIRAMRPSPITLPQVAGPLAAVALPGVPLLFLAFPAGEVLQQILKLVF